MNIKDEFLLKSYQNVFSKPQMLHFAAFLTGLSACEKPSISRMSEIHTKSRSSFNRFLTESPWEIEEAKSAVRSKQQQVQIQTQQVKQQESQIKQFEIRENKQQFIQAEEVKRTRGELRAGKGVGG